MDLLTLTKVNKAFGSQQVLKGLDLAVPQGAIYGFVGENGAGKTTTMRLILGLEPLDSGTITFAGQPVRFGQTQGIGYLPDVPAYYGDLSAREYLTLCGRLTHTPHLHERVGEMLHLVGLPDTRRRVHGFSRGMKQRLGIASALLDRPAMLLCDEPTSALDPAGRREFLALLASVHNETTILLSTHILSDVERICDYVGILHAGKLQVQGPLQALLAAHTKPATCFTFGTETEAQTAATLLGAVAKADQVTVTADARAALTQLLAQHLMPTAFNPIKASLEQLFMEVIA
ncbi:ABC transporter ATP-binding protein [Lacticaseibacillus suibinensis]|uniref:ABC transporter ATP-binding protein n=1 Tax=Lacticaseibacillus suibinensis TaxID=2486011 RepID=UPI0019419016|nr:ABC transporter ATP-binding protein [Lacticaseibacillus suibinensis]